MECNQSSSAANFYTLREICYQILNQMNHRHCQHNLRQHRHQTTYNHQALLHTTILPNQTTKTWLAIITAMIAETTMMMIALVAEGFLLKALELPLTTTCQQTFECLRHRSCHHLTSSRHHQQPSIHVLRRSLLLSYTRYLTEDTTLHRSSRIMS